MKTHPQNRFFLAFLLLAAVSVRAESTLKSTAVPHVALENSDPEMVREAEEIVFKAAKTFTEITQQSVADVSVRVRFVFRLKGSESHADGATHLQGITRQTEAGPLIEIARNHTASWGRILAHEVTHVFVRETYGEPSNSMLHEGLAEYIAEQIFPYEVRADLRRAALPWLSQDVRRYWEGHRFCHLHVKDPHFATFFEDQIKKSDASFDELLHLWNLSKDRMARLSIPNR